MRRIVLLAAVASALALTWQPASAQILTTSTTTSTSLLATTTTTVVVTTTSAVATTSTSAPATTTTARRATTTTTAPATTTTAAAFVPPTAGGQTTTSTSVADGTHTSGSPVLPLLVLLSIGGFAVALTLVAAQYVATRPRRSTATAAPKGGRGQES